MKVMFRRCTSWYSKTKRGYNSRSTGAICHVAGGKRKHVRGNILLHQHLVTPKMYLIFCQNEMAGVLSFNAIEPVNKSPPISVTGWMSPSRGQGIMCQSLQALMTHYARRGVFGASSLNAALIIRPVTQSHGLNHFTLGLYEAGGVS